MSAAAANLIVNWVNNGGRMMTTTGYHNYGYQDGTPESTNVNMLIRPFGVTYSITTNPNEVRIFGAKTDITGFTASTSPIPTAILNGPSGAVSRLMINAGAKIKGWTGTADGALPPNSNNFITYASQNSPESGWANVGVALIANPYSTHPGKINVWGDEWITYDDVWSSSGKATTNWYQAGTYWENLFTWFEQGCTP
jgi:hypothetical protein